MRSSLTQSRFSKEVGGRAARRADFKKMALSLLGCLSLAVGIVGIFVPLLPTTCFLLLAVTAFSKSSKRLYRWSIENRWFGHHVERYREKGTVCLAVKLGSSLILWLSVTLTCWLALESTWGRAPLVLMAAAITVHVLALPSSGGSGGRAARCSEPAPSLVSCER